MRETLQVKVFSYDDEAGDEYEDVLEVPARYEVCDRCDGHGAHTNPSIDGDGISAEEWYGPDWDDESREDYMSGAYDVRCETCHGKRVVPVVDRERCTPEQLAAVDEDAAYRSEIAAERRSQERWGY